MPHYLSPYRDRLNALIGPLEEIEAKIDTLISEALAEGVDLSAMHYAGVTGAKIEISNLVAEVDEFVEPEPEQEEDDEEFTEDELAEGDDEEDEDA